MKEATKTSTVEVASKEKEEHIRFNVEVISISDGEPKRIQLEHPVIEKTEKRIVINDVQIK